MEPSGFAGQAACAWDGGRAIDSIVVGAPFDADLRWVLESVEDLGSSRYFVDPLAPALIFECGELGTSCVAMDGTVMSVSLNDFDLIRTCLTHRANPGRADLRVIGCFGDGAVDRPEDHVLEPIEDRLAR